VETLPLPFNPDMLILARNSRGLNQTELAEKVGVTQSRISKLEDGLSLSPPEELVDSLSRALGYPSSFFYQHAAARAVCHSFYRKRSGLPSSILSSCDARMNIQRLHIEKLVKAAEFETRTLPFLDPDEIKGGAREVARQLRSFWGIPKGPIKNLVKIVEDAGCIVVLFDFGTLKLDGLSLFANDGTAVIFLNKHMPGDRIRLTLAHELGHIIMHRVPKPEMEEEAYAFAGEFLIPEAEVKSSLYPVSLDKLARLKLYWRVSMAALLKRAADLGVITERQSRYLWMQMGKYGYRSHEPHEDQIPLEQPSLLRELISLHLGDLEFTADELASVLAVNRAEFDQMYLTTPQLYQPLKALG